MKDHQYFVYIVCSRSGTLYIGMTNSITAARYNTNAARSRRRITAIAWCNTKASMMFSKAIGPRKN